MGGLKCQISRNKENEVVEVTDNLGNPSKLYRDALEYTGVSEDALDIWAVPYTEDYREAFGIWGKEPLLRKVLSYIDSKGIKKIFPDTKFSLLNSALGVGGMNTLELSEKLLSTFVNEGQIVFNRNKMINSGLYTIGEVDRILSTEEIRKKITKSLNELRYSEGTPNVEISVDEDLLLYEGGATNNLGKLEVVSLDEVESDIKTAVVHASTREEFDEAFQSISNPNLVDKYNEDSDFSDRIYNKYKDLTVVPAYTIVEGGLVRKTTNNVVEHYKEVLQVGYNNDEIIEKVNFLQDLPTEVWQESIKEVADVVKEVEELAIDFGIDIIGLNEKVVNANRDEVMQILNNFMSITTKLRYGTVSTDELASAMQPIVDFNGGVGVKVFDQVNNKTKATALHAISTTLSDEVMFTEHSMIKIGEGLYQKINKEETTTILLSKALELMKLDTDALSKEAVYPTGFNVKGEISEEILNNPSNMDKLMTNIYDYYVGLETTDVYTDIENKVQMNIYKDLYNISYNTKSKMINNVATELSKFDGNIDYLTTDFLVDFNKMILKEKFKGSKLYNSVLNKFSITSRGLDINVDNNYEYDLVRHTLESTPMKNNLKNYGIIAKNPKINRIFAPTLGVTEELTLGNYRDASANNPSSVPFIDSEFYRKDDLIVTKDMSNMFLRPKDNGNVVYEKIAEYSNMGVYRALPDTSSTYFNVLGLEIDTDFDLDLSKINNMSVSNQTEIKNMYSNKEHEDLQNKLDNCG